MRKQITLPDCYNNVLNVFSKAAKVSESCILSIAFMRLYEDFLSLNYDEKKEKEFLENIRLYYKEFYIKKLPRGLKAKKGGKNA